MPGLRGGDKPLASFMPEHGPTEPQSSAARAEQLLAAMESEMKRSLEGLRVPGNPRPYHLLYSLRRAETLDLRAG